MKIKIKTSEGETTAELNESRASKKIYDKLPIEGKANLWGDEIYFEIPLELNPEEGFMKQEMKICDLAYWPPGNAFCIFFGKTPASTNENPRAASEVILLGNVESTEIFKKVKSSENITLKKA